MKKVTVFTLLAAFTASSALEARHYLKSTESAQERKQRRDRIAKIEAEENEEEYRTT
jgi:hypothetical protein